MSGWRLIETAPKDGTELLLFCKAVDYTLSQMLVGHWAENRQVWEDHSRRSLDFVPSHWMDLPDTPSLTDA